MNLEKQFFQYFFYPFLLGMTFSVIVVITCSVIFTNNFIDTITGKNMLEIRVKQYYMLTYRKPAIK